MQEKDDGAFMDYTRDAVNQAVWDADNQSVMGGPKEESPNHIFVDPILEYMEVLMDSNSQAWILCKTPTRQRLSPSMVTLILKTHT